MTSTSGRSSIGIIFSCSQVVSVHGSRGPGSVSQYPPAKVAPGAAAAVARDPDQTWLLYVEFEYYKTVCIEVILSTV